MTTIVLSSPYAQFTDRSIGKPVAWLWDFGDDSQTSTERNPFHAYAEADTYIVTLVVTDAQGRKARAVKAVVVPAFCVLDDPRAFFVSFDSLVNTSSISPVDQYGALGFDAAGQHLDLFTAQAWNTCPWTDWCDGPENDGTPEPVIYTYRWQVFFGLDSGNVFYRRAGNALSAAPAGLFPSVLLPSANYTDFSLPFDANARPVFAFANLDTGEVELRRFIADVPTFHSWTGHSPKLIYDGQMQRDSTLTDVVCYYIREGLLYARFQRDVFAVEYLIADVSGTYGELTRLTKTDRNVPEGAPLPAGSPIVHYLFARAGGEGLVMIMLRAGPYDPFPIRESDTASMGASAGSGLYQIVAVEGGLYDDAASIGASAGTGSYDSIVVDAPPAEDDAMIAASPGTGSYDLVVVVIPPETDVPVIAASPASGDYVLVVIVGGTYTDSASVAATPASGNYTAV